MKINLHIFIFLLIAILASINDIIIYFFKINYNMSLFISVIFVTIIAIFLIKRSKIKIFNNFEKKDLFFLVPYLLINSLLFLSCDSKFDTYNYHIYNQQSFFNDKINFDYLPNCSFFFPLGDRMFYIFRNFLGFRFGTVLSFYTLIVLFYQVKYMLGKLIPNLSNNKNIFFSFLVLLTVTPNLRSGSYHVDNFSMIILLEMFCVFIRNEDIIREKSTLYYLSLLLGIATGIKIINVLLGGIIIIMILIYSFTKNKLKIFKEIKFKDIVICFILFILPFSVYMIYNYLQTGNPVFPILNNVFKSEYYEDVSGRDVYFGMPNILTTFIWPIIVTIDPLQGIDFEQIEPLWAIGYICCLMTVIYKSQDKDIIWKISLIGIVLTWCWAIFLNGYVRYALVIPMSFYIIVIYNFVQLCNSKLRFKKMMIGVISVLLIYTIFEGVVLIKNKIKIAYQERVDFENYQVDEEPYEIDGVWGSFWFKSGFIELIRNPETPMYNLDISRGVNTLESDYPKEIQEKMFNELRDKKIYTVIAKNSYEYLKELVKSRGFQIMSEPVIYKNSKYQNMNNEWYIVELKYIR